MNEILSVQRVKTRKPHRCWGCARLFPPGTVMDSIASTDVGKGKRRVVTDYWCDVCQGCWSGDYHVDDRVGFGDVRADDPDGWNRAAMQAAAKVMGEKQ